MVHGDKILDVQKPVDQSLRETSAWLRVTAQAAAAREAAKAGAANEAGIGMIGRQRDENPAGIDLPLDPLPGHSSRGRLERVLRRGEFAVTAELNPPDSADPEDVYNRAEDLRRLGRRASTRSMPRAPTATCRRSASARF